MLEFSTIQPAFPDENVTLLAPYASNKDLIPFQFHSSIIGLVTAVYLINNSETTDITADITIKKYSTALTSDGAWYVHFNTAVANLVCGTYQLKIVVSDGVLTANYYSNFFKIVNVSNPAQSLMYISSSKDILGKLYNSITYYDVIYFKPHQIKQIEPFIFENKDDNGDGTETIIYQNFAKQYEIKFICDKHTMNYLSQLYMFDEVTFYYEDYSGTSIFQNLSTDISFNDDIDLYEVTINLKIGELDKNICETDFVVNEYTTINDDNIINNAGDKMLVNANDKLILN
jgi:hypothetical protein